MGSTQQTTDGGRLWLVAAAIVVANLLDAILTLGLVSAGLATEANPLMATPLDWGAMAFMSIKISLVSLCVLLLWRLRRARTAVFAMGGLAAVYGLLMVYHLRSMDALVRHIGDSGVLIG